MAKKEQAINKKEKKEIIPIRDMILTVSAKWIS
mgnify:CR=1 FL=1